MIFTRVCEFCGNEFTFERGNGGGYPKACNACRYENGKKTRRSATPEEPKRESQVTNIAVEARKLGLTYGQYQARKWLENNKVKV
jgi:hypothetical protein